MRSTAPWSRIRVRLRDPRRALGIDAARAPDPLGEALSIDGALVDVPVRAGADAPALAERGVIARFADDGRPAAVVGADGALRAAFDIDAAARALRHERGAPPRSPVAARLPFHYHAVPGAMRFAIARALGAVAAARGEPARECAPPDAPADVLERFALRARAAGAAIGHPAAARATPGDYAPAPLCLTHDLDTAAGLRHVDRLARIAEARGVAATFFVCARVLDAPGAAERLRALAARGHELGCHGLDHDVRTPLRGAAALRRDLDAARAAFARAGLPPPAGYRAPAFSRTPAGARVIAEAGFRYDASVPAADCGTVRPFRRGRLVRVPLTLPGDHDLLFAGLGAREGLAAWRSALDRVVALRGIAVLLVHPEPHLGGGRGSLLRAYERLLDEVAARADVRLVGSLGAALAAARTA